MAYGDSRARPLPAGGGGPSLPLASPTRVVLKVQSLQQQHGLGACEKFLGSPGRADRPPGAILLSKPSMSGIHTATASQRAGPPRNGMTPDESLKLIQRVLCQGAP